MVELLEDVDASTFDAAMLFLDEYVDPSHAAALSTSLACVNSDAYTITSAAAVGPSPSAMYPTEHTTQLLDEHTLFTGLFPPSPAPPQLMSGSAANHQQPHSPSPLPLLASPLRIAPLAVDYFPMGVEMDRPYTMSVMHPMTAQTFAPSLPIGGQSPFTPSSPSSVTSHGSSIVVKKTTKKPKRPPTYNSNKAREERRQELLYLRRKVTEMEQELVRVKDKKPRVGAATAESTAPRAPAPSPSGAEGEVVLRRKPGVWEEIAAHQLEERRRAERENEQLKVVLETQIKIAKSLETILNKRSTLRGMEACGLGKRKRVFANSAELSDRAIFEELLRGVEQCYLEVDRLFDGLGIGALESSFRDARMRDGENGMYMEIYANNVLPFTVQTAGKAAWQYFAHNINHLPFRQYYERIRENMNVTEDTIVENVGLELHANNTKALFRLKQVLRRYVEEDRVVIVWTSIIDPIEFADKPFTGFFFREKGYMLLQKPKTYDASEFCVLKTCYVITPEFSSGSMHGEGDEIIGELTEFVLSGTAASISASHQVIENMLLAERLKKPSTASPASATAATGASTTTTEDAASHATAVGSTSTSGSVLF